MFKPLLTGLAAVSLVIGTTASATAIVPERDAAPVSSAEALGNDAEHGGAYIYGLLGALLIAGLVIFVVVGDADEDGEPVSA